MIAKRVPNRKETSSAAKLVRYVVNAKGGEDPRDWTQTATYILDGDIEKNGQGEKVGGVRVSNCGTDDPAAATTLIQATQSVNTRSKKDKTYHLVFSFPPGETPPLEVLNAIEDELCASIGYADHQRVSAVHVDKDHLHVHVAINKVHPTGFQNIEPYYDKRRLMESCERLEVEHGLQRTNHGLGDSTNDKSHSRRRERAAGRNERGNDSAGKRADGAAQRITLNNEPGERSTAFRRYLRKSYDLPITRPAEAKTIHGLRNLSGSNVARITDRFKVLLPGDTRAGLHNDGRGTINRSNDGVRRQGNGNRADAGQRGIGNTAATIEIQSGIETLAGYVSKNVANELASADSWKAVHAALAEHGLEIKPRGSGLVIGDPGLPLWVRASQCDRRLAMKAMTDRLGPFSDADKQSTSTTGTGPEKATTKANKGYKPKPTQNHPSSAQLFAQYQRERQEMAVARKSGFESIKRDSAAYVSELDKWRESKRAFLKAGVKGVGRKLMRHSVTNEYREAKQKNREAAAERRQNVFNKTAMPAWNDWLAIQAQNGNTDALAVLRSRSEREAKLQGDLLTAEHADRAKTVLMKNIKPIVRRDGVVSYKTADGGRVLDRKTHVHAQTSSTGASLLALTLASEKYAGQPLAVNGTEEFKSEVARLAGLHSINVTFSDPEMEKVRQQGVSDREGHKHSRMVDHGPAPYQNEKGASDSYFVTLEGRDGKQHTLWGVDLERSVAASGAKVGDRVDVEFKGSQPVTFPNGQTGHRNTWDVTKKADAPKEKNQQSKPPADTGKPGEPTPAVTDWIKNRNKTRENLSSIDYHRLWVSNDAGKATYQGRRHMNDGTEVLLLKRGDEMLVKPATANVVAKAAKWKVGRSVNLDARGRFLNSSRVNEI